MGFSMDTGHCFLCCNYGYLAGGGSIILFLYIIHASILRLRIPKLFESLTTAGLWWRAKDTSYGFFAMQKDTVRITFLSL